MGDKYVITAGGNLSNAATWDDESSAGVGGDGKPSAGDSGILDSGSGNLTVDEDPALLTNLTMTGYTGTMTIDATGGNRTINVDENTVLSGTIVVTGSNAALISTNISLTKAAGMDALPSNLEIKVGGASLTGNITTNKVKGGDYRISTAGTRALTDGLLADSFLLSDAGQGGTFDQARYRLQADTVLMKSGTTWSNPGPILGANISDLDTSDITWAPGCSDLGGNSSYVLFGRLPGGPTTTGTGT